VFSSSVFPNRPLSYQGSPSTATVNSGPPTNPAWLLSVGNADAVPNDEPDEARPRSQPERDQARLRRDSVPAKVRRRPRLFERGLRPRKLGGRFGRGACPPPSPTTYGDVSWSGMGGSLLVAIEPPDRPFATTHLYEILPFEDHHAIRPQERLPRHLPPKPDEHEIASQPDLANLQGHV